MKYQEQKISIFLHVCFTNKSSYCDGMCLFPLENKYVLTKIDKYKLQMANKWQER